MEELRGVVQATRGLQGLHKVRVAAHTRVYTQMLADVKGTPPSGKGRNLGSNKHSG